jgi:glycosyltransferase involved in cell wall biosynthesis
MKKIILDCDLMRHPDSGLYHYCLNLGLEVKKILDREGSGKMTFYTPPVEKKTFGAGAGVIVEKLNWKNTFKTFLWGCDIWHAPFQSGRIVPYDNRKIKVVLTVHDLNVLHEDKPDQERKSSLAHTQKLINRADAIVCISDFCRQDVLTHCEVGNKPIYVIHNGTHRVASPSLNGVVYKPKRPFLFNLGYVNRKKNQHTLLPMLKHIEMDLVIAGKLDEPDYISKMKEDAQEMGIAERVHILGPVSEKDKAWYFQNCQAFVFPSIAEGFGAPVVEAMSFGKPIFLSGKTSLPEIGGNAAFYFNDFAPLNMKNTFEKGMAEYKQTGMADIIKKRGQVFQWETKAREYVEMYKTLF